MDIELLKQLLDNLWVLVCAGLVFLMQPGFLCLESGLTRSKNSINVAIKNLADFGVSVLLFWAVGFGLMYGASRGGLYGWGDIFPSFVNDSGQLAAFFLFQAMFCGTATTIVSGAVAERMTFRGYLIVAMLISGLIFPVFGHWAWADDHGIGANGNPGSGMGWLKARGFVDFAGATAVHGVGGWVALAAVLVIGPRLGRFSTKTRRFASQNLPLAMLGVLLLWAGWLGFNGGSTGELNDRVPGIILNTVLAGAAGMMSALLVSWLLVDKRPDIVMVMNGSLAGLVAITAGCHAVSSISAALIGAAGGLVMMAATRLLEKLRIDDVVGAVPVHAAAGAWGTLAVALFGDPQELGTGLTFIEQLAAQVTGVAACFLWSFCTAAALLLLVGRLLPLRVSKMAEERGLNVSEHEASTELYELLKVIRHLKETGDFSRRAPAHSYTEVGQIAHEFNEMERRLRDMQADLERTAADLELSNRDLKDFAYVASHDLQAPLRRMRSFGELLEAHCRDQFDEEANEYLAFIVGEAARLQKLVDNLLAYSRVDSRGEPPQSTDPAAALDQVLAVLDGEIQANSAVITHDPLPRVMADRTQLAQLLQNLVSNAIKYCRQTPRIHISARRQAGEIEFRVRDNGIGVPPEKAEAIFQMFRRLHSADEFPGSGLGLAICQRIINRHGGRIWVESNEEHGVTVCFTLRAADEDDPEQEME